MNQGRHPGREATRRGTQQAQARHPALVNFIHSRILPHLRALMLARAKIVKTELVADGALVNEVAP